MRKGSLMDDEDLKRRLDALGTSAPVSSKIARLRRLYVHVEAALLRGASRQDVLSELNSGGFDMTMTSFKSALQRIRAEQKRMQENPSNDIPVMHVGPGATGVRQEDQGRRGAETIADMFAKGLLLGLDGRR